MTNPCPEFTAIGTQVRGTYYGSEFSGMVLLSCLAEEDLHPYETLYRVVVATDTGPLTLDVYEDGSGLFDESIEVEP